MTGTIPRQVSFDPLDPALTQPDPATDGTTEVFWSVLDGVQARCPVAHSLERGFSVLTRRDDVIRALQEWESFSSASGVAPVPFDMGGFEFRLNPIDTDPPYHRGIRKLLNPYFSPATAARLAADTQTVAHELIDGFVERGSCDFMAEFANPLPSLVFFRSILGLSSEAMSPLVDCVGRLLSQPDRAVEVLGEMIPWCQEVLDARKHDRRNDVLDAVVHGVLDDGRTLNAMEQLEVFVLLIIGGLETTAAALGNSMKNIAADSRLRDKLISTGAIGRACDEFLRFEAPIPGLRRQVTQDVELSDVHLGSGDWVYVAFGAANRDPSVWVNPDELDIDRADCGKHSSFGVGPHRCLGSHLARMELRVGIGQALERLAHVRLDPDQPITWRNSFTRGPLSLPLLFGEKDTA